MSSTLTYVYCLVRSTRQPSLRGAPGGMPGSEKVRLLDVDLASRAEGGSLHPGHSTPQRKEALWGPRHWLVVSTVPARMYGEATLERGLQHLEWIGPRALAHEAVTEHFLGAAGVLPMQLFTLFTSDARAVAHVVRDRRHIARILSRIEGHVEWGLRVMWGPTAAGSAEQVRGRQRSASRTAGSANQTRRAKRMSGAEYLAHKREARNASRVHLRRARTAADRVYRAIRREARGARRRTEVELAAPGSPLILDAAFLVPSGGARAFRAAVRRHSQTLERAGMTVSLTGPWPAYNFI